MRLRSSREIQHFRNVMHDIQRRNSSSISGIRYEDDVLSNNNHDIDELVRGRHRDGYSLATLCNCKINLQNRFF